MSEIEQIRIKTEEKRRRLEDIRRRKQERDVQSGPDLSLSYNTDLKGLHSNSIEIVNSSTLIAPSKIVTPSFLHSTVDNVGSDVHSDSKEEVKKVKYDMEVQTDDNDSNQIPLMNLENVENQNITNVTHVSQKLAASLQENSRLQTVIDVLQQDQLLHMQDLGSLSLDTQEVVHKSESSHSSLKIQSSSVSKTSFNSGEQVVCERLGNFTVPSACLAAIVIGTTLQTSHPDGVTKSINLCNGQVTSIFTALDTIKSFAIYPGQNNLVLCGTSRGQQLLYDVVQNNIIQRVHLAPEQVCEICYILPVYTSQMDSLQGSTIITISTNGQIVFWNSGIVANHITLISAITSYYMNNSNSNSNNTNIISKGIPSIIRNSTRVLQCSKQPSNSILILLLPNILIEMHPTLTISNIYILHPFTLYTSMTTSSVSEEHLEHIQLLSSVSGTLEEYDLQNTENTKMTSILKKLTNSITQVLTCKNKYLFILSKNLTCYNTETKEMVSIPCTSTEVVHIIPYTNTQSVVLGSDGIAYQLTIN